MNEKYKYDIIKKLVETNGNKKRASIKLNLSIRQINRLINGYKEFGKEFFVHGNRGRKPSHALTEDFKNKIEELYTTKYFDCTYTAFKEYLEMRENINISIDEARIILRDRYIFSPRTHKSTKKKFKEKLQKELEISKAINKKALKDKLVIQKQHFMQQ
jgi:transposase